MLDSYGGILLAVPLEHGWKWLAIIVGRVGSGWFLLEQPNVIDVFFWGDLRRRNEEWKLVLMWSRGGWIELQLEQSGTLAQPKPFTPHGMWSTLYTDNFAWPSLRPSLFFWKKTLGEIFGLFIWVYLCVSFGKPICNEISNSSRWLGNLEVFLFGRWSRILTSGTPGPSKQPFHRTSLTQLKGHWEWCTRRTDWNSFCTREVASASMSHQRGDRRSGGMRTSGQSVWKVTGCLKGGWNHQTLWNTLEIMHNILATKALTCFHNSSFFRTLFKDWSLWMVTGNICQGIQWNVFKCCEGRLNH